MEKDFNKEVSNSDEITDEELSIIEKRMVLLAKQQSLQDNLEKLKAEIHISQQKLADLQDSVFCNDFSQSQTSPFKCSVSPISQIYESQNLPDSTTLAESSRQLDVSCGLSSFVKEIEDDSNRLQSCQERLETEIKSLLNSPPKTLDNEMQASGSYTELDSRSDLKVKEMNSGLGRYYAGKGKKAANPHFRYKKGSRTVSSCVSSRKEADVSTYKYEGRSETNVSSCESLSKDSPAKPSEASGSKSHFDLQASKAELKRIPPAMMRKRSVSNEIYYDRRHFDESCASTLEISDADDDDDLKIGKKMKFEGRGKNSIENPFLDAILSVKGPGSSDIEQFKNKPQTDHISNEREPWNLPSKRNVNIGGYVSTSEESSLGDGSEIIMLSDREDSPLTNVSDMSPNEREESSLASVGKVTPLSGEGESQHFQSEDKSAKAKDETSDEASLTSISDMSLDERE